MREDFFPGFSDKISRPEVTINWVMFDSASISKEMPISVLSPAVNNSWTAVDVTTTLVRLYVMCNEYGKADDVSTVQFDRVVEPLKMRLWRS